MGLIDFVPLLGYFKVNGEINSKYYDPTLPVKVFQYSENLLAYLALGTWLGGMLTPFAISLFLYFACLVALPLEYYVIRAHGDRFPGFFGWAPIKSMPRREALKAFIVVSWNALLMFFAGVLIARLLLFPA